jgi:bifunctional UDP-N-acetylglucosamine pyrophosphorylase/glucosamine-1-phosphate N-acetyltransferase
MADMPLLIILAGGASSRMWPLREKSLIRFGDEPLMARQLRRYAGFGLTEAVIVANPESEADIRALADAIPGVSARVVVQPTPKGMGDALLCAAPGVEGDRPLYVVQVHDVTDDVMHHDLLSAYAAEPHAAFIAGYEREDYFPGGYLIVDAEGRITGIVEKPGAANRPSNLVNIVAHIHPSATRLFDAVREEYVKDIPTDDHYERAMDRLMGEMTFRVVPYRGVWNALKFPWHTLDIMNTFLAQIEGQHVAESAFIAKTATLVGNVVIGEGAKVFPGAAVVGPAYIGAHTIVGNNALVRNSMVLDHCNVGFTTEVARSYVADHCDMHACRVLDSVFAPGVNFSAGCTTANLRIDRGSVPSVVKGARMDTGRDKLGAIIGQGAFIAVDVMTMPGVKIGERAQVGPGMHVHHDLKDGVRAYVKQEITIIER